MPVAQAHVIDAIARDAQSAEVALIMTEPRPWDGSARRLYELQEKVNAYLSFALDGEMAEAYPECAGWPLRLQLDCLEPPDAPALGMIAAMREQIAFQGIRFDIRIVPAIPCGADCGCAK